ncbi:MAG TPA: hypothetical protein VHV79_13120 [Mycobacteriales bacterium]|nr:hypothetical protein [Mycobacteriales bacterium]
MSASAGVALGLADVGVRADNFDVLGVAALRRWPGVDAAESGIPIAIELMIARWPVVFG